MQYERKEFKYYVSLEKLQPLRERILAHMDHDPFCRNRKDNRYHVRSIYFDTPGKLFYFEKIDGVKIRKKLRVRAYNDYDSEAVAFLEIKRKNNDTVFKERAMVPLPDTLNLMNGARLRLLGEKNLIPAKIARDKFIYLTKRLHLEPTALITYEREAFVGRDDPEFRVTFDFNVRSFLAPDVEDLFREEDLRSFTDPCFILEIKFSRTLPVWTRMILRDFRLRLEPISKYCEGIDVWESDEGEGRPR